MSTAAQPAPPTRPEPASGSASWSAQLFSLPALLALLLVYILFWFSIAGGRTLPILVDTDVWWHLRDAALLLHTHHFIRADPYTFAVGGRPWIDFEWLGELPYYFAFCWLGDRGLYLVTILVAAAIVAGIYRLALLRSRSPVVAFVSSLLALLLTTVSLFPRPLLFGWLFLVVEIAILWNLASGRDRTAWLPLLFLLWINTHGSWFIGFVLMALFFACGFLHLNWGILYNRRWTPAQARKFVTVTVASCAALFVNPYGWRLVVYPLDVAFRQRAIVHHIAEWRPLDFHSARGVIILAIFLLLAILQFVRRRRWPLHDLLFAAIALYGAITSVRFLFLVAILVTPLLAIALTRPSAPPAVPTRSRPWLGAVIVAAILTLMAVQFPSTRRLHAGIAAFFPEKALPCIRTLAARGPVFNHFEWGGYLEWHAPAVQEFIDPRNDIFIHAGVMQDYLRATAGPDLFPVLDRYRIRYAILAQSDTAAALLARNAAWTRTYDDGQTVVFKRRAACGPTPLR